MAMAVNIDQTPKKVEDEVRKAPANQGKNEFEMQQAIDAALTTARTATTLNENFKPVNRYGAK